MKCWLSEIWMLIEFLRVRRKTTSLGLEVPVPGHAFSRITFKAVVSWLRSLVVLMLPSALLRFLRGVGTKQFLKL